MARTDLEQKFRKAWILPLITALTCSLNPATSANPGFLEFSPHSSSISNKDRIHGETQVELMIKARPEMSRIVRKGGTVWTWVSDQFAGNFVGSNIYWSDTASSAVVGTLKEPNYPSYCIPPSGGRPGRITVVGTKNGIPIQGEQLWASAVFELFNIRNGPEFSRLETQVAKGEISKDDFIRAAARLEYAAKAKTAWFYHNVWKSDFVGASHDEYWGEPLEASFDEWLARFSDRFGYPWGPYGKAYDLIKARCQN